MTKIFLYIKKLTERFYNKIFQTDYTQFVFFSILIGAAVGFATVLFHNSIEFFNKIFFTQTKEGLFFLGAAAVIVLPALGMLIQSVMISFAPDISKERGVAEVIKSVAGNGKRIPLRTTIFHFIAPVLSIGSGNTVGPEAPAAQLGGGVANKIAHLLKLSDSRKRVFTAAGSGAAIAAIFNTPMGGIFFALEIILLNEFQTSTFSALILASVTSSAISRIFLGDTSVFVFQSPNVGEYHLIYLYAVMGVLAGFISLLFIKYSNVLDSFLSGRILKKFPRWIWMMMVGLIMGVCGYFYKEIFGVGYAAVNSILNNSLSWQVVAVLLGLKFILVPLILNSGGFGGIFAPSLFMGACFGFLFGTSVNYLFGLQLDVTAFILVGMGAVLGGINSIPIASILIIFEMTKDYSFILPLMLAVVASTMVVNVTLKKSIHERHLEKQGYRIHKRKDISLLGNLQVKQVMKKDYVLIPEDTPLTKVLNRMMDSSHSTFFTIGNNSKLNGIITESELRPIITEYEHLREVLVARDISTREITTVLENDDLDHVMKLFESKDADELPVVDENDNRMIIGSVTRQDVITAYNKENLKLNLVESFSRELRNIDTTKKIKVMEGFAIVEKKPAADFWGKSIAETALRSRYGLEILMIKKLNSPYSDDDDSKKYILPKPDYIIQSDDLLVLFGPEDKISITNNW